MQPSMEKSRERSDNPIKKQKDVPTTTNWQWKIWSIKIPLAPLNAVTQMNLGNKHIANTRKSLSNKHVANNNQKSISASELPD